MGEMKRLFAVGSALILLITGVYNIGKLDAAHNAELSAAEPTGWQMTCNGVVICQPLNTPTPIVQQTATATAARTQVAATPTKVTGTPLPTPTYSGACSLAINGAERTEPKGMIYYQFTDPGATGATRQNIRREPINGAVIGVLNKGDERLIHWHILADGKDWYALDEGCGEWVASWLGTLNVHP